MKRGQWLIGTWPVATSLFLFPEGLAPPCLRGRPWDKIEAGFIPGVEDSLQLGEIGEFGLIRRLSRESVVDPSRVVRGIGDDTAVLRFNGGKYLLATCDMLVEGEHFLLPGISPRQLGHRALAASLSDIAAMGGIPLHALVSLGLPGGSAVEVVDELYQGLKALARRWGVNLVGGDTVSSPRSLVIDVMVLGEVEPKHLVLRSGARPGDLVLVTGQLGASRAGLQVILHPEQAEGCPEHLRAEALEAHRTPLPRIGEARALVTAAAGERQGNRGQGDRRAGAVAGGVTAMADISDGLSSDLHRIAEASGVGARLWADRIPVAPSAAELARLAGESPLEWAIHGGEDYELLFTARPEAVPALMEAVRAATGTAVTVIGEVLPVQGEVSLVMGGGKSRPLSVRGWDHFRD